MLALGPPNFVPLDEIFGPPGLNISTLNMKYSVPPEIFGPMY